MRFFKGLLIALFICIFAIPLTVLAFDILFIALDLLGDLLLLPFDILEALI